MNRVISILFDLTIAMLVVVFMLHYLYVMERGGKTGVYGAYGSRIASMGTKLQVEKSEELYRLKAKHPPQVIFSGQTGSILQAYDLQDNCTFVGEENQSMDCIMHVRSVTNAYDKEVGTNVKKHNVCS